MTKAAENLQAAGEEADLSNKKPDRSLLTNMPVATTIGLTNKTSQYLRAMTKIGEAQMLEVEAALAVEMTIGEPVEEVHQAAKEEAVAVVVAEVTASSATNQVTWLENVQIKMLVEAVAVVAVVEAEHASNVTKKVTWLENVLTQMLVANVVEVAELASNAMRKATWQENAQMLKPVMIVVVVVAVVAEVLTASSVENQVTWLENALILTLVVDVAVEEAVVVVVPASNAIKRDTWQETVQMAMEAAWIKEPTRDQEEMMATQELMMVATGAVETVELATGTLAELPAAGETTTTE